MRLTPPNPDTCPCSFEQDTDHADHNIGVCVAFACQCEEHHDQEEEAVPSGFVTSDADGCLRASCGDCHWTGVRTYDPRVPWLQLTYHRQEAHHA